MKPKLIILNGPLGIGKSTLATKFAEDFPLTLRLDIDDIRLHISHWREHDQDSSISSKQMAVAMAKIHLRLGHNVVVPQIISKIDLLQDFENAATENGADFYEVLLFVKKDEAIKRFVDRGKSQGLKTGFRPGGLIDKGGREKKLSKMYEDMMAVASKRPNTIKIEPVFGQINETYQEFLTKIS